MRHRRGMANDAPPRLHDPLPLRRCLSAHDSATPIEVHAAARLERRFQLAAAALHAPLHARDAHPGLLREDLLSHRVLTSASRYVDRALAQGTYCRANAANAA